MTHAQRALVGWMMACPPMRVLSTRHGPVAMILWPQSQATPEQARETLSATSPLRHKPGSPLQGRPSVAVIGRAPHPFTRMRPVHTHAARSHARMQPVHTHACSLWRARLLGGHATGSRPAQSVQWSEDGIADPLFGRSRVRFRVRPWVSNTIARDHLLAQEEAV